jgi:hypothetical protein
MVTVFSLAPVPFLMLRSTSRAPPPSPRAFLLSLAASGVVEFGSRDAFTSGSGESLLDSSSIMRLRRRVARFLRQGGLFSSPPPAPYPPHRPSRLA